MAKKYKIERNLVLNDIKEGGAEDRVMVIDENNEVGSVPRSEFGDNSSLSLGLIDTTSGNDTTSPLLINGVKYGALINRGPYSPINIGYETGGAGDFEISIGAIAGNNSNGHYGINMGPRSGLNNTGYFNVFIGANAGIDNIYSEVVILGSKGTATASNQFVLGAGGASGQSRSIRFNKNVDSDLLFDFPFNSGRLATLDDISGGSQGLDEVLETGDTAINKSIVILNQVDGEEGVRLQKTGLDVFSTTGNLNLNANQIYLTNPYVETDIRPGFMEFKNVDTAKTGKLDVSTVDANDVTLILPFGKPEGTYTLATLDDISSGGNQDLQSVMNNGASMVLGDVNSDYSSLDYSFIFDGADVVPVMGMSQGHVQSESGTVTNSILSQKGGKLAIKEIINNGAGDKFSELVFGQPIADCTFSIPAKSEAGDYILATSDDLTLQSVLTRGNTTDLSARFEGQIPGEFSVIDNYSLQFQSSGVRSNVSASTFIVVQGIGGDLTTTFIDGFGFSQQGTNKSVGLNFNSGLFLKTNETSISGVSVKADNSIAGILTLQTPNKTGEFTIATTDDIKLKGYTVATLPAGTIGDVAYVTDANDPSWGTPVYGGGAFVVRVFHDGTAWTTQ